MQVNATEAKNRFGYYLGQAEREPVHVMKNDRVAGVIVSAARFAELEALEQKKSMVQRKREFNEADYDSTLPVLTAEGWVGDDIIKEDVAMRAELVNVPAPSDYHKFFDYSIVRKIYRDLKSAGWKPTP